MLMSNISFGTTHWSAIERREHKGECGVAYRCAQIFEGIRVRMVYYTPAADH